jgi:tartrate dehydratase alpha subunit/fumarate hydratase class I-like protein
MSRHPFHKRAHIRCIIVTVKIDTKVVENICKELYIRALKRLPDDIKQGFARLDKTESDATGKRMLGTMIQNIAVAVPGHRHPHLQRHDRPGRRG